MKRGWWLAALLVCLALACLSPLASAAPDGLERVAGDRGFLGRAQSPPLRLMADYLFPGVANPALATVLAGATGTTVVFALVYGLARLLRGRGAR